MSDPLQAMEAVLERLVASSWKERDGIKDELVALADSGDRSAVTAWLEEKKKDLKLELRWEIDEVLERLAPPPAPAEDEPEEEAEEAEEDPNRPLQPSDLNVVYDDPRGFTLHKTKTGERWFATQRDPRTGQPQTFELHPQEIDQVKKQLEGSPYWVLGAGA